MLQFGQVCQHSAAKLYLFTNQRAWLCPLPPVHAEQVSFVQIVTHPYSLFPTCFSSIQDLGSIEANSLFSCLFFILPLSVLLTASLLSFFAPVFAPASLAYICKVNSRSSLLHLLCSFSSRRCQDFISVSFCQLHFMKSPLCKDIFPSLSLLVPRKSILIHNCVALKVSHKNRQAMILQLFAGT